jgi:aspartyl-tRNA(Asn)/glutamyl-tRNA(Gln) amidotransferase subunit C
LSIHRRVVHAIQLLEKCPAEELYPFPRRRRNRERERSGLANSRDLSIRSIAEFSARVASISATVRRCYSDPRAMEEPDRVIDADEVRRIAALAHLPLSPEEVDRFTRELGTILAYVKQLEDVDVAGVPPTAQVAVARLPLRPDEPGESLPRDLALREAPRVATDGFAVPAFVDEG